VSTLSGDDQSIPSEALGVLLATPEQGGGAGSSLLLYLYDEDEEGAAS